MKRKKKHKHHSNKKTCFIHRSGGLNYTQYAAQKKNIDANEKLGEKTRQKKGKL